jgi:trans-2,3-dihydro-3-hydroxyanthranilate isomerase
MEHRFYTLDVFTTTRFEGNPLAVFTDGDGLSDDQMQAIAREMNLAETVFVQKQTAEEALARLRIFTTKEELKLAGHPVIGTWFLLAELGVVPRRKAASTFSRKPARAFCLSRFASKTAALNALP